ncbi:MAG: hypothetical protein ACLS9K_05855 [Lachnospira eligens]
MINYGYISRINQSTNEVIMKAGETLKLGRSYKDTFMKGYMQSSTTDRHMNDILLNIVNIRMAIMICIGVILVREISGTERLYC